jgi:hypothetical protein
MVKNEFKAQMDPSWKMYDAIINHLDDRAWTSEGTGYVVPVRVAIHVPVSIEYYIGHASDFRSRYEPAWTTFDLSEAPSRLDTLHHAHVVRAALDEWIANVDPDAENTQFEWAGKTQLGVVLFIVRHTMYHIGELNALLYQSHAGKIGDPWMTDFQDA